MEPTSLPDAQDRPETTSEGGGATRRGFIRGIAAAGASTAAVTAFGRGGFLDAATARAAGGHGPFADFRALAASAADAFEVPEGYRADVVIGWGDEFADDAGQSLVYGYNNDFLAYFPIKGSSEGLVFVNHEYPGPFFQHGVTDPAAKTPAQIALEQAAVGNSIVHLRKDGDGVWQVVQGSRYNRRVTATEPRLDFTGPLAGNPAYPGIGATANGSLANCSGGITPWGTALSCEENYQDYPGTDEGDYGWTPERTGTPDYLNGDGSDAATAPAKYGWVCEHDPFDPSDRGRKHTALGRFRHENTAFRAERGKPFVLYMGDDKVDAGVYKFVSELSFRPGRRSEHRDILTRGTLYIARWEPEGRRRFDEAGTLLTPTSGTGSWWEVTEDELVDTDARITAAVGEEEFLAHYATNRPEDLEVDEDGTVYIALTNNAGVSDVHGSVRRLRETGAGTFDWEDFAAGGPSGRDDPGEQGFSAPDNLVFDSGGNVWVVTDISSGTLNDPEAPQAFHANNAVFMVPRTGPNAGIAFRFANMPVAAEGTGPYFTPDERTLFLNVQHPGETTPDAEGADPADPATFTSWWPRGNRTAGEGPPAEPLPSMVAVTKVGRGAPRRPPR